METISSHFNTHYTGMVLCCHHQETCPKSHACRQEVAVKMLQESISTNMKHCNSCCHHDLAFFCFLAEVWPPIKVLFSWGILANYDMWIGVWWGGRMTIKWSLWLSHWGSFVTILFCNIYFFKLQHIFMCLWRHWVHLEQACQTQVQEWAAEANTPLWDEH